MNHKQIGIIVIILGVIIAGFVFAAKLREDKRINDIIDETGSCYLKTGECLHEDRDYTLYIIGWIVSTALVILGLYLLLFDKTQHTLAKQHEMVSIALKEAKDKDEFKAFLSGFNEEEQRLIKAIKEQDGITQSTLRYRTGMSKAAVSIMLKSFEERKIITRKESGKTFQVYLRQKF